MARQKRTSTKRFSLQMGWGGVLATITGTLAAIIWTFVLGVWVGKKISIPVENIPERGILKTEPAPIEGKEKGPLFSMNNEAEVPQKEASKKIPPSPVKEEKITEEPITAPFKPSEKVAQEKNKKALKEVDTPKVNEPNAQETQKAPVTKPESKPNIKPISPYFALQVASFKDKKYAQQESIRWRNRGFKTIIKTVDLGPKKGVWHRVCIGQFHTIAEAKKGARLLKARFKQKSYIVPVKSHDD